MARVIGAAGRRVTSLDAWEVAVLPAGAAAEPPALPADADWVPMPVPGTAGAALIAAGRAVPDLDARDAWFRTAVPGGAPGRVLRFGGVATLWDAWFADERVGGGDSMFLPADIALPGRAGVLHLRCRAPEPPKGMRRARWRPALVRPHWMRGVRTTLSGRMAGWWPGPAPVGPWRGVAIEEWAPGATVVRGAALRGTLGEDGVARLSVMLRVGGAALPRGAVTCAGVTTPLRAGADGSLLADLVLPGASAWWPHTHGEPALHAVTAVLRGAAPEGATPEGTTPDWAMPDWAMPGGAMPGGAMPGGAALDLGRTGFRRVSVDRGADGRAFGLVVNGVPVFARGAVWTAADPLTLGGDPLPFLRAAREAGFNLVRVPGTGVWESDAFHAACDELGLMVWHDAPLASADHPEDDPGFAATVVAETRAYLDRTEASPSLVVVCGGSEVAQSAAMNGVPPAGWYGPLRTEGLRDAVAAGRPNVAYVPDSPSGPEGDLPHRVDAGVAHYFGVGAYLRPPGDARAAGVRFASECLAFANMPADDLPGPPVHPPEWKRGVPRDPGAGWDFDDVRDHYLRALYGADPARLRWEEPERYLALSRAVTGDLMEATVAEWRRPGSSCRGAVVLSLQDVLPGAGWGVLDHRGRPKPALHALRRACAPLAVLLLDEGVNGVAVHAVNDRAEAFDGVLELACFRGGAAVVRGEKAVRVPGHGALSFAGEDLFGRFFDAAYAWRFGPPACDATWAGLIGAGGEAAAEAALFPQGFPLPPAAALTARAERDGDGWVLAVEADRFARAVRVEDEAGFAAAEDWFPLPPGRARRVRLRGPEGAVPRGRVAALNAAAASYRGVA